jgi:hypothetical protein
MNKTMKRIITFLSIAFLMSACADMDVQNLNQPDTERALSSANDLKVIASGLYESYYYDVYQLSSPVFYMGVSADNHTCSWGNFGMRNAGTEPRPAFDNTVSYPYQDITSEYFDDMYATMSSATDVLTAIDNGVDFGAEQVKLESFAKFVQASILSDLALTFDKAFIVTEDTPEAELLSPEFRNSAEVAAKALELFDEVIALTSTDFTMEASYLSVGSTSQTLNQLANTKAARLMAYMPRTKAENESVDWAKVKAYAANGIVEDFMINNTGDSGSWYNLFASYINFPGWGRVDMRVINMMDDTYPAHNPEGLDFSSPENSSTTKDARLLKDFAYVPSNNYRPERGLYFFSNFRHNRYDAVHIDNFPSLGISPMILKAENDLILAEAELQLGNYSAAADIINNGTRTSRGEMAAISADPSAISAAIHHERQVELMSTSYGAAFFDMRGRDLLQAGTLLEFPVPAKTLEVLQKPKPYYTTGGDNNSSSSGGWR